MGQALYRKYRSKSFDEVVGQEHVTTTLQNAIKSGRISHAYLFTGPRGVGKTSVARILAHEVNGLDYQNESTHLDIVEIDAASNRRIDEIRELRDKVHITPTSAKYKVYIIDEVHMLTREAFNALLKTLEEPPAHCIFILATTESHKLPETITSRTQRFEFKPVGPKATADHLASLAKKEKLDIEPAALELLAQHGQGSFRDSISLLDQLSSTGKKITEQDVRQMVGLPAKVSIDSLLNSLEIGDSQAVLGSLDELREQGAEPSTTARLLASQLRQLLISGRSDPWITTLLKELLEVPASSRPFDRLEISILETAAQNSTSGPALTAPTVQPEPQPETQEVAEESPAPQQPTPTPTGKFKISDWARVMDELKNTEPTLYAALRLAEPKLEANHLTLIFHFPLHQKKVNTAAYKQAIGKAVNKVSGDNLTVESIVDKSAKPGVAPEAPKPKPAAVASIDSVTISNIFGEAEVLESGE